MLAEGTRFVHTLTWTIDINECGENYYDVYHVVSATPKSLLLVSATLFRGDIHVKGNELMDSVLQSQNKDAPVFNGMNRYMLKKDKENYDYFITGKGTARKHIYLNGPYAVKFITRLPTSPSNHIVTKGCKRPRAHK